MPVPPLHEGILNAAVHAVALEQRDWQRQVVEDVQDRNGDDGRDVKPDRDVDVALTTLGDRAKEVDCEGHPNDGNRQIDRPFQLGVLFGLSDTERQRERCGDDDRLPTPEVELAQRIAEHARFEQTLTGVVDGGEDAVPCEGEDRRIRVKRSQAAEAELS